MNGLFIFGLLLCIALVFVIIYYFSPKRKGKVEQAKYDMLDDTDGPLITEDTKKRKSERRTKL